MDDLEARTGKAWTPRPLEIASAVIVLGALGLSYAPCLAMLVDQWQRDPNNSYGYLVIPIAAVVFWSHRGRIDRSKFDPKWWGFLPLLALLALRYPLYEWNEQYAETATLPPVVGALALAVGGWHLLKAALPAVLFLGFMLPLPPSLNAMLSQPLQHVATVGSLAALQTLGMPVMAEGNVIVIGGIPLEVARACNGLSMLLSFVTLIVATVILVPRPVFERVVLLLSAVPIAVASNVLRITATALAYHYLGQETGEKYAHDYAGWAMMPVALLMVWVELWVLSRLFVEVEEVDAAALLRRGRGGMSSAG